jgi:hypothetical protein
MNQFNLKYSDEWHRIESIGFNALAKLKTRQLQVVRDKQNPELIDIAISAINEQRSLITTPNQLVLQQIRIDDLLRQLFDVTNELFELKKQIEIEKEITNL